MPVDSSAQSARRFALGGFRQQPFEQVVHDVERPLLLQFRPVLPLDALHCLSSFGLCPFQEGEQGGLLWPAPAHSCK